MLQLIWDEGTLTNRLGSGSHHFSCSWCCFGVQSAAHRMSQCHQGNSGGREEVRKRRELGECWKNVEGRKCGRDVGGREWGRKWVSVHWIVNLFPVGSIPKAQLSYAKLSPFKPDFWLWLWLQGNLSQTSGPSPTLCYSTINVQNLCMDSILLCPITKWVYRDSIATQLSTPPKWLYCWHFSFLSQL